VILYRLARARYATDLSGAGAQWVGGRCNPPGTAAVYTAENISLAVLEILVHLDKLDIPEDYVLMAIELGGEVPIWHTDVQTAYAESVRGFRPVVGVPSFVVPRERNYVLYPQAANLSAAIIWREPFHFDSRLFVDEGRYLQF